MIKRVYFLMLSIVFLHLTGCGILDPKSTSKKDTTSKKGTNENDIVLMALPENIEKPKVEPVFVAEPIVVSEPVVAPKAVPEPIPENPKNTMPIVLPQTVAPKSEPKQLPDLNTDKGQVFEPKNEGKQKETGSKSNEIGENNHHKDDGVTAENPNYTMVEAASKNVLQYVNLCYSYFTKLTVDIPKEINVKVSADKSIIDLENDIKDLVEEQEGKLLKDIEDNIQLCLKVPAYEYLIVELEGSNESFIINSKDSAKQSVVNGSWTWNVTAKSDIKSMKQRLTIYTRAVKKDGTISKLKDRYIHIDVQINTNFLLRIFNYLYDNPAYLLSALIIPFITYLSKLRKKKKEEDVA